MAVLFPIDFGQDDNVIIVELSINTIELFLKTTNESPLNVQVNGIPQDAEFYGAYFDWVNNKLLLKYKHNSFGAVNFGERVTRKIIEFADIKL